MRKAIMIITGMFSIMALMAGCGGATTYGEIIDSEPTMTIAEALGSGETGDGEKVVIEGDVSTVCPAGCWVEISDEDGNILHIAVGGDYAIPQKESGKTLKAKGKLRFSEGKGMIELVATGIETR